MKNPINTAVVATVWIMCCIHGLWLNEFGFAQSQHNYTQASNDPREIWQYIPDYDDTDDTSKILAEFDEEFEFGLATAASHSEDNHEDSWLEYARRGGVRGFGRVADPESRLKFFSDPVTEIKLAQQAGVQIFRLSVSWNRLVPRRPDHQCLRHKCPVIQNQEALARYKEIFALIKQHNMKLMLTLFHHDLPKWAIPSYSDDAYATLGWTNPELVKQFYAFSTELLSEVHPYVDYLITFNEPTLFAVLTHMVGHWPSGPQPSPSWFGAGFDRLLRSRDFFVAMDQVTKAHKQIYTTVKQQYADIAVGVSHITPYIQESSQFTDLLWNHIHENAITFGFPDSIIDHLDFLGVNYYGEESLTLFDYSLKNVAQTMYSDSGRILNAGGLYKVLHSFYERYSERHPDLKYFVTENGIADDTDLVRMPFIVEHLYALQYAREQGIPVAGYIFWTISDNWEWADGYCPKFGLVHVDRAQNLRRTLKPSYFLFQHIIKHRQISQGMRDYAHNALSIALKARADHVELAAEWDGMRGFCRHEDGLSGLDSPVRYPIHMDQDWLFNPDDH